MNNEPGNDRGERDREIQAIALVTDALQHLSREEAIRVMRWAANRFQLAPDVWFEG